MSNPLAKMLQEAREYYRNKPSKYNLTPEQRKQIHEQLTGKPSADDEQEQPNRISFPDPGHNYYKEFQEHFKEYSDEKMVEVFNGQVYNSGTGSARMAYLAAIRYEFNRRGFDYSAIGGENRMSYMNKVKLEGKKIVIL
jgi:hypothetical protein